MNTTVADVVQFINGIAPFSLQEDYDNSGLIVGDPTQVVSSVLLSLDCIESVVDEAIGLGCNLIIAHHPILFRGLKRLNGSNYVERTIIKAIKHDIALLAVHTNLDNVLRSGVNERIGQKLGLKDLRILSPNDESGYTGAGIIGEYKTPMQVEEFLKLLRENMQTNCIKHTNLVRKEVKRIAVCGGSGSFLLGKAIQEQADVFVTSDFKYHEFFDADQKIVVADIGHYESERYTIDLLYDLISNKFTTFAAHCTKVNTNPVNYY